MNLSLLMTDSAGSGEKTGRVTQLTFEQSSVGVSLKFSGYGCGGMEPGHGDQVFIELYEGKLMLHVFADINSEEPTHSISLEGAREELRKEVSEE